MGEPHLEHAEEPWALGAVSALGRLTSARVEVVRGQRVFRSEVFSAAENETVFIMLLPSACLEGGVVLMDEPDLHLHAAKRRIFFQTLYRLLRARGIQAIISTHSPLALQPDDEGVYPDSRCLRVDPSLPGRREVLTDWRGEDRNAMVLRSAAMVEELVDWLGTQIEREGTPQETLERVARTVGRTLDVLHELMEPSRD